MNILGFQQKTVFVLLLIIGMWCNHLYAQDSKPRAYKNTVVLDVVPFYYDFFDYRQQIRLGIDYTRQFQPRWFLSTALDVGLFDDYTYIKYYDFFNQNQGFYSITQDASISGFHLLPSYNYYFFQSKRKQGQGFYGGGVLDMNYYRKKLQSTNSQTQESNSDVVHQFRTGLGVDLGVKYFMGHHFFAEVRSMFFCKAFLYNSNKNTNKIMSLNSQWTSNNRNFWLLTSVQFGYAF